MRRLGKHLVKQKIITHSQDNGIWKTEFPRLLMKVRDTESRTPDTSDLSPEEAEWLRENWNNISFSVEPKKQMVIDSDKTVTFEKPLGDSSRALEENQSTKEEISMVEPFTDVQKEHIREFFKTRISDVQTDYIFLNSGQEDLGYFLDGYLFANHYAELYPLSPEKQVDILMSRLISDDGREFDEIELGFTINRIDKDFLQNKFGYNPNIPIEEYRQSEKNIDWIQAKEEEAFLQSIDREDFNKVLELVKENDVWTVFQLQTDEELGVNTSQVYDFIERYLDPNHDLDYGFDNQFFSNLRTEDLLKKAEEKGLYLNQEKTSTINQLREKEEAVLPAVEQEIHQHNRKDEMDRDLDGDGISNSDEMLQGTDPYNAASNLHKKQEERERKADAEVAAGATITEAIATKNSEQNKKAETKLGDFPEETQGAAPLPEANVSQPLNDLSPSQTRSQPLLHFSINEDRKSIHKDNYHPISDKDLLKLNRYAPHLQNAAQWYLENVADSQVTYFYQDGADTNSLAISYNKESFMHLTGIFPYREGQTAGQTLLDFAAGNGQFDNILIANRGAAFDKLKVLPELPAIVDAESFYFGDLSDVEKFHSLNLDKAIRSNDQDVLLAFRTVDGTVLPASLMRLRKSLNLLLDQTNQEKIILGVFRERDGHIEQLSINEEYVKDKGAEMLSVLKNKQFEEVSKEIEQSTPENTLNSPLLDAVMFTQVLDTVYNLGVPADISKTPEEFHQAWNQYLDYAKQHNDKFDQIVAAAGEDHLLDTNSDFYKEWKQDHIYKENYHVRLQWSEERPDGPRLPFKETELISYQEFARELYKANQDFYQLHQEGLEQVAGGHPEAYITPTKIQFSIYAPDGELIQDSIRYNIGEEINPIAHKERLGTREMREYPELMKIDGAIFTPYHLERLASELDISQFSYALEDTLYADQLLSQLPFGDLENSPIGFTDSSHDARLGFISFDGMDSIEVENLSAWFDKLGVKDSPMDQVALVEKWQKEIKSLSEKVEQTIAIVREEFEKSQEEEIKLEEQGYNKQELERDADADGVSDEEELLQGTNPYDFRSKPGSKPKGEESLQADEIVLAAGSLAVADFIQNKDMAGLSRHLKEGIKEFLDSDKYKDYLTKMSQLNNYSNRNLRLILAQNPEARQVASFKQWKENFGRYVKKGEKALRIFKPMTKIKKDENNQPILDKNGKPETVTFFGLVPVFDVSQTEGKEMPKAAEVKEQLTDLDYANLYRALMVIAKENDVSVRFEEMENNKHGYYSVQENQIVLRSNEMNKAQIIKTFLHEMAHAELHHADNPQKEHLTRSTAELQAESVAYVVSSYYGIDTSEYSFNYLSGWSADKETLADLEAQLDIVQQEAKSLMVRMDQALEQLRLSQEKQTKRSFEQKLEKFKDQSKQAVEEHKQELKADAQSKKEKGFSK